MVSMVPEILELIKWTLSFVLNGLKIEIRKPDIKSAKLSWKANPRTTTNKLLLVNIVVVKALIESNLFPTWKNTKITINPWKTFFKNLI